MSGPTKFYAEDVHTGKVQEIIGEEVKQKHPVKISINVEWDGAKKSVYMTGESVQIKAEGLYPREFRVINSLQEALQSAVRELRNK